MLPDRSSRIFAPLIAALCISLFISLPLQAAEEAGSLEKIDNDFRSGVINRGEMLIEKTRAIFAPDELSATYKSDTPVFLKSGTEIVMEVYDNWDLFSPDQQQMLKSYLSGPEMTFQYDSPGGFFKIHYDTVPPEKVPPEDLDGNNIPDYVERTSAYLDSAYNAYTAMGFLPPPTDSVSGGDERYDVYLISLNAYGVTIPDGPGDSAWNDYKSYIWIHYSFLVDWLGENDDPQGDTIGAQKVTAAHEFHHAVQFAYVYNAGEYQWLMEMTSTWMEEVLFPEVNDNHNYLFSFLSKPHLRLHDNLDPYHKYGGFVWMGFLHQKFDPSITRRIWEAARYNTSLDAVDSGLAYYGTDLKTVFPEFTLWNYYTGDRAVAGSYYAEAADYPQVAIDQVYQTLINDSLQPVLAPDGLGCNYAVFTVDTMTRGFLEVSLDGSDLVRWAQVNVAAKTDSELVQMDWADAMDPVNLYVPYIEDYDQVVVVPAVVSRFRDDNNYFLNCSLIPYGDANFDREVNVGDASFLINYVFFGGVAPEPLLDLGDTNCDGGVNVADAVTIINYVFKDGQKPCADRGLE